MKRSVSIWLIPEARDNDVLARLITRLARQHGTPLFSPHLTLEGPRRADLPELILKLEESVRGARPIELDTIAVEHSAKRFEAVVVRLALTSNLADLRSRVASAPGPFHPHVSLIYGNLSVDEREAIQRSVEVESSIVFSRLAIVAPGHEEDWDDVAGWQVLHTWILGQG